MKITLHFIYKGKTKLLMWSLNFILGCNLIGCNLIPYLLKFVKYPLSNVVTHLLFSILGHNFELFFIQNMKLAYYIHLQENYKIKLIFRPKKEHKHDKNHMKNESYEQSSG